MLRSKRLPTSPRCGRSPPPYGSSRGRRKGSKGDHRKRRSVIRCGERNEQTGFAISGERIGHRAWITELFLSGAARRFGFNKRKSNKGNTKMLLVWWLASTVKTLKGRYSIIPNESTFASSFHLVPSCNPLQENPGGFLSSIAPQTRSTSNPCIPNISQSQHAQ